jgi:hypothetical protein
MPGPTRFLCRPVKSGWVVPWHQRQQGLERLEVWTIACVITCKPNPKADCLPTEIELSSRFILVGHVSDYFLLSAFFSFC